MPAAAPFAGGRQQPVGYRNADACCNLPLATALQLTLCEPAGLQHLGRADQQRLAGDLVVAGKECQIVPPGLGHGHPQLLEDKLGHHERVGMMDRDDGSG